MPAFAARGVDEAATLAVLVWFGPAQVAGRFVFAWLGRGLSLYRVGLLALMSIALAFALFAWSAHPVALLGFALLFGAGNGLVTIVRGGLVPEIFGRTHVGPHRRHDVGRQPAVARGCAAGGGLAVAGAAGLPRADAGAGRCHRLRRGWPLPCRDRRGARVCGVDPPVSIGGPHEHSVLARTAAVRRFRVRTSQAIGRPRKIRHRRGGGRRAGVAARQPRRARPGRQGAEGRHRGRARHAGLARVQRLAG